MAFLRKKDGYEIDGYERDGYERDGYKRLMTGQTAKRDGYEKAPSMGSPLEGLGCTSPQSPCCGDAVVITKSTVVTLLRFTGTRVHLILQKKTAKGALYLADAASLSGKRTTGTLPSLRLS